MSKQPDIKKRLIASFMQFLNEELKSDEMNSDSKDSVEVAIQCLETAFEINPVDGTLPSKTPILEIFQSYLNNNKEKENKKVVSEEDKAKANDLKTQGNELMKNGKYQEALEAYTKAIQIDDSNPIYYCNRAAAHSKLENHLAALEDSKMAVKNDPNYSKAYCRMGLAYVNLNDHLRARDSYKIAYELDPSESNKNNLRLAEEKVKEEQAQFGGMGNFNLGNMFNNPQFLNMASQMMQNPNLQNMFSELLNNSMGGSNQESSSGEPDAQNRNTITQFLEAGKQFAEQLRDANPELIEQLKNSLDKNLGENNSNSKPPDNSSS